MIVGRAYDAPVDPALPPRKLKKNGLFVVFLNAAH